MRRFVLPLLALALGWLVLIRGYADYLARPEPERALALSAGQPEALMTLADAALRGADLDLAQTYASRALESQPLEGRALRILGAVAERRGEHPRALALMRAAAERTPRDSAAQFWLAINALADRDLGAALLKLDRLVRFEPELQRDVFPIFATIASNPVGASSIAPYLAADAPWRDELMQGLVAQAGEIGVLTRLLRAIEAAGGRIRVEENALVVQRLWTQRDFSRLRPWLQRMDPDTPPALLYDTGFDGRGTGPWRGWSIEKAVGVDAVPGADLGGGARGLRLVFHDRRVPYRHISQRLLLPPGHYRMSARLRLFKLDTAQGLRWLLSCVDNGETIASTEALRGDRDWSVVSTAFDVAAAGCGGQELRLQLGWRIAAEQQIRGEAWFDELRIEADTPGGRAQAQTPVAGP